MSKWVKMATSAKEGDREKTVRQLLAEIRLLEGSARLYQSRLEVIQGALTETLVANSTLDGIKGKNKGTEILLPVGADSFIRAEIQDSQKIIMGIGAGVCMEKDIEACTEDLKNRKAEFEKLSISLRQQLSQTLARLEQDRNLLGQLLQRDSGKESQTV